MAAQEPPQSPNPETQQTSIFQDLTDYPWDSDPEFQSGLRAILGPDPSPSQAEHLTLRARCFYYSRYIVEVSPDSRINRIDHHDFIARRVFL